MVSKRTVVHRSRFVDFTPGSITAMQFSHRPNLTKTAPLDLRLAVGRSNGDIEIWNPRNDWVEEFLIHGGKNRSIEGLCWSSVPGEPLRLFSVGGSTVVTEWDLATGLAKKNYDCNAGVIWSIAINESMTKLAVGCDNGTIVIIDISGGSGSMEHEHILMRQEAKILSLAWNGDDYIVGGCSDGKLRIWCVRDAEGKGNVGRILHTMKVDKSKTESTLVWSVLYLPVTNQIVSGDSTGSVKIWDFEHATLVQSLKPHEADVLCLATDATNSLLFSAGVDRKIFQFSREATGSTASKVTTANNSRWTVSSNRLLHSNDVRALCSYQARGTDILISGGTDRTFIINSLSSFLNGRNRRITSIHPFFKNVLVNTEQRLVVAWQESTIKIWSIGNDLNSRENYTLVCKLTLREEQNITNCAMSPDGQVLVVSWGYCTKLFHLLPTETRLKVTKLDNELLLRTGSKYVNFIDNSKIILCNTEDELMLVDLEADNDEEFESIELPEVPQTKLETRIPYWNTINLMDATDEFVVVAHRGGAVDIINLETREAKTLVHLSGYMTAIKINKLRHTVLVVSADNKIYEFNIPYSIPGGNAEGAVDGARESESGLLTQWSKKNTDNLPSRFRDLPEKCLGIIQSSKYKDVVWFWGTSWIVKCNQTVDLPVSTRKKQKKRSRDGLTITTDDGFIDDNDDDERDDEDNLVGGETEDADISGVDLTDIEGIVSANIASNINGTKDGEHSRKSKSKVEPFVFIEKYNPILFADFIGKHELVVVERPFSMVKMDKKPFGLSKLIF